MRKRGAHERRRRRADTRSYIAAALAALVVGAASIAWVWALAGDILFPEEQVTVKLENPVIPTKTPRLPSQTPAPSQVPEPTETPLPEETPATEYAVFACEEAVYLAKVVYGEALVCPTTERAAVVWCILNRVDDGHGYWADDVIGVVTQPSQFHGYDEDYPVLPELYELALDVLGRWQAEKNGASDVGRVLPAEYLYFHGDGEHNYFRTEWRGGVTWDWSLPSPYEE